MSLNRNVPRITMSLYRNDAVAGKEASCRSPHPDCKAGINNPPTLVRISSFLLLKGSSDRDHRAQGKHHNLKMAENKQDRVQQWVSNMPPYAGSPEQTPSPPVSYKEREQQENTSSSDWQTDGAVEPVPSGGYCCPYRKLNPERFNRRDHPNCADYPFEDMAEIL